MGHIATSIDRLDFFHNIVNKNSKQKWRQNSTLAHAGNYAMCSVQRHPNAHKIVESVLVVISVFQSATSVTERTTVVTGATRPANSAVSDFPHS